MAQVQALLDGEDLADRGARAAPETEPSLTSPVAEATDSQVMIRSLTEQLVSEANAVLADHAAAGAKRMTLIDEVVPGALAFTVGYGPRSARVETVVSGHSGTARLVLPGAPAPRPVQLSGDDQLKRLLLTLITPPSAQPLTPAE